MGFDCRLVDNGTVFINEYRTQPVEIGLNKDGIFLRDTDIFQWHDIKHIGIERLGGDTPTKHLVLTLHNNKKIDKDIEDLELGSQELIQLISKYVEARKLALGAVESGLEQSDY